MCDKSVAGLFEIIIYLSTPSVHILGEGRVVGWDRVLRKSTIFTQISHYIYWLTNTLHFRKLDL